jgi:cytochrome P450
MSARLALRPFTFSNGATVPPNTFVALPLNAIDTNEEIYPNPDAFDGFRFSRLRDGEDEDGRGDARATSAGSRHQAIATSSDHLTFGIGRHIW